MEEFIQTWDRGDAAARAAAEREQPARGTPSFFSRVQRYIEAAERSCGPDEALVVAYARPSGELVQVRAIHYHQPDLVVLQGTDANGEICHVLVNVAVLELLLKKSRLPDPADKRPISFATVE